MAEDVAPPSPRGLWFEDFEIDRVRLSSGRTVTESDLLTFGGLTGDLYELHTNEDYARTTPFGGRISHGMFNLALMHGLICRTGHVEGTGVAMIGWDDVRFLAPIRIGDTVHTRFRAVEMRLSRSRPETGVIVERLELVNQRGVIAVSGRYTSLVRCRPA